MSQQPKVHRVESTHGGEYTIMVEGAAQPARLTWKRRGDARLVDHTFVPPEARGQGLAAKLVDAIVDDARVRAFLSRCMLEAAAIGARGGLPIDADPESRHAATRQLGAFRTSMLQDVESGKLVELDVLLGSVLEIAQ